MSILKRIKIGIASFYTLMYFVSMFDKQVRNAPIALTLFAYLVLYAPSVFFVWHWARKGD